VNPVEGGQATERELDVKLATRAASQVAESGLPDGMAYMSARSPVSGCARIDVNVFPVTSLDGGSPIAAPVGATHATDVAIAVSISTAVSVITGNPNIATEAARMSLASMSAASRICDLTSSTSPAAE
jgi:hypothetical protein